MPRPFVANSVLLVDGSTIYTAKRAQNIMSDEDVEKAFKIYQDYTDVVGYFATRPESEKAYIIDKILYDVKGRMLEDIVLLETSKACPRGREAFRFKFEEGGEYDMVVCNETGGDCCVYEIKHSDKIVEQQTRYLRDESKIALVAHRFGKIIGK